MTRVDGRAPDQLRPVTIELDFVENPAGSALIRMGRTVVLCTASLGESVPGWMRGTGRGWVTSEYSLLPGSTDEAKRATGRPSRSIRYFWKFQRTGPPIGSGRDVRNA